jgi:hypothetical protein
MSDAERALHGGVVASAIALGFIVSTLPTILPRQREIEAALREREQAKRKRRRPRTRRPQSS